MKQRIILEYSGGVDTTAAISSLAEQHDADIVAVALDLGQGRDLAEVRDRARAAGAVRCHVLDVRDEFVRECLLPLLKTDDSDGERDTMRNALGRSFIVGKLVEIAQIERAAAIAHGWCGEAGDEVASAARALDPGLKVIGIRELPEESPVATGRVEHLDRPASVEITFVLGAPIAINNVPMSLSEAIECLSTIAGDHGFAGAGYADSATVVLHIAHRELEGIAPATLTGSVRLELFKGECRVMAGNVDQAVCT